MKLRLLKHLIASLVIALPAIAATSCIKVTDLVNIDSSECTAKGPVITRTSSIPLLNSIDASRGLKVIYKQSTANKVTVSAPSDIMDLVTTKVKDGEIEITTTKNIGRCGKLISVTVESPSVTKFEASSGSTINIDGSYNTNGSPVEIDASSGAAITTGSLTASELDVEASSGAAINLSGISTSEVDVESGSGSAITPTGKTAAISLDASSGSVINASDLQAANGKAEASSGAIVNSFVTGSLEISKSSGGMVSNRTK